MLKIKCESLRETLSEKIREGYTYLEKITATDYIDHIEALYFIRDIEKNLDELIRFDLPAKNPKVPSVMDLYIGADWYERELGEMFGIEIVGRKAKRLLLEKWDGTGAPLRKSFEWGKPYDSKSG
ncbi:MAG: NADH-quinone oxidoreductase subunit C [Candidatus Micrarchaeota archaeon]|nr:NADH-quinone oxidoreductase subunit C [Candidatus Micrarchaeota archaeon]MDE1848096.1 NADH-quinone oxidoreductase subunit C [Candidatus Micrarchaeota archaeon]MDE1864776.1 NADH-quinone oxidoreductase subunit C [Candidatus Micrarchaeota archaeon]